MNAILANKTTTTSTAKPIQKIEQYLIGNDGKIFNENYKHTIKKEFDLKPEKLSNEFINDSTKRYITI